MAPDTMRSPSSERRSSRDDFSSTSAAAGARMSPSSSGGLALANRSSDRTLSVLSEVGIDTIKVTGTAPSMDLEALAESRSIRRVNLDTGEINYSAERARIDVDGDLRVDLFMGYDGVARWSLETSLPKRVRGNNLAPLTLQESLDALSGMRDLLEVELGPIGPIDGWIIGRLDLVRDFHGVRALPTLLEGLGGVRVPRATRGAALHRGQLGHFSTLVQGSPKSWQATLYDKHQETLSNPKSEQVAEPGHLRYELSLRRYVLRRLDRDRVRDLDQGLVHELAHDYFTHAGFDQEVKGMDRTMFEIRYSWDELTDQERKLLPSVVGSLELQAAGLEVSRSRATVRKYQVLADKLGIGPADFRTVGDRRQVLDFDSGQQIFD